MLDLAESPHSFFFFSKKNNDKAFCIQYVGKCNFSLALLHSEWPKLHRVLAILSAKGLTKNVISFELAVFLVSFYEKTR